MAKKKKSGEVPRSRASTYRKKGRHSSNDSAVLRKRPDERVRESKLQISGIPDLFQLIDCYAAIQENAFRDITGTLLPFELIKYAQSKKLKRKSTRERWVEIDYQKDALLRFSVKLDRQVGYGVIETLMGGSNCPLAFIKGKDFSPIETDILEWFGALVVSSFIGAAKKIGADCVIRAIRRQPAYPYFHMTLTPNFRFLHVRLYEFEGLKHVAELEIQSRDGGNIFDHLRKIEPPGTGWVDRGAMYRLPIDGQTTRQLVDQLRTEHPQTIAAVLSRLDATRRIAVLAACPDALHFEILRRMTWSRKLTNQCSDLLDIHYPLGQKVVRSGVTTLPNPRESRSKEPK